MGEGENRRRGNDGIVEFWKVGIMEKGKDGKSHIPY